MNTLSAASASLHKAYTHTHTDFFISSSFRAHACAPLGGLSQRFRKMCSSIWGEIIQGVSSRHTTIICIGKIGMNVSVSVPSFCCNDSPLHVRTFSVAYGDDKKKAAATCGCHYNTVKLEAANSVMNGWNGTKRCQQLSTQHTWF